ncbi:protein SRG1 [Fagus crenata]
MASLDLAAPSVIEHTKEPMIAVPQKYIRPYQEPPAFSDGNPFSSTVPTIDMKQLVLEEDIDLELEKLHSTCKEWGLFQLVNHGVSSSLLEKLKHEIEEFFKLPLEENEIQEKARNTIESYFLELQTLAMTLVRLMGKALKIEIREMED